MARDFRPECDPLRREVDTTFIDSRRREGAIRLKPRGRELQIEVFRKPKFDELAKVCVRKQAPPSVQVGRRNAAWGVCRGCIGLQAKLAECRRKAFFADAASGNAQSQQDAGDWCRRPRRNDVGQPPPPLQRRVTRKMAGASSLDALSDRRTPLVHRAFDMVPSRVRLPLRPPSGFSRSPWPQRSGPARRRFPASRHRPRHPRSGCRDAPRVR